MPKPTRTADLLLPTYTAGTPPAARFHLNQYSKCSEHAYVAMVKHSLVVHGKRTRMG